MFAGCVGNDENSEILEQIANESGLQTLFQYSDKASTATCAVLLTNQDRFVYTSFIYGLDSTIGMH
jgi:sugar/nucleoside kinase (ribokinase family)